MISSIINKFKKLVGGNKPSILDFIQKKYLCEGSIDEIKSQCSGFKAADDTYFTWLSNGGFIACHGALRFFSLTSTEEMHNIQYWNSPDTWKFEYNDLLGPIWCFAEDVFGNQFVFYDDYVGWLDCETGNIHKLCHSFSEWIRIVEDGVDYYTGASLAYEWNRKNSNEQLNGKYHLSPVTPFTCNGAFSLDNLFRVDSVKNMGFKGNFATQIKDVPDGAQIKFTFS